ncbi:MAG: hypothetical protein ACFFCW_00540 [Candidatus Hodarchaeota archaeon]
MSDECTKSGTSLWLMLDLFFMGLLFIELAYLKGAWVSHPELGKDIALIISTACLGSFAGIVMLNQGLSNKAFDMRMRVTLVATGSFFAVAALLTGAVLSFLLF